MLVEHYPNDKRFEEVLGYLPELSCELRKIDEYLEDEKLYKLIRADLSKRYPKTEETGRCCAADVRGEALVRVQLGGDRRAGAR